MKDRCRLNSRSLPQPRLQAPPAPETYLMSYCVRHERLLTILPVFMFCCLCGKPCSAPPLLQTIVTPATNQRPRLWSERSLPEDHKWILKLVREGEGGLSQPGLWANHQLTGAGPHKRVPDVDWICNVVTETLTCTKCRSSRVSLSQSVLTQLELGT